MSRVWGTLVVAHVRSFSGELTTAGAVARPGSGTARLKCSRIRLIQLLARSREWPAQVRHFRRAVCGSLETNPAVCPMII